MAATAEQPRLLVVEDNPDDVQLIDRLLERAGLGRAAVSRAGTMHEAIEHLAVGGVDLTLLDLGLPDSDGLDTVKTIVDAAPEVAVVVLTGRYDAVQAAEVIRQGVDGHLAKNELTAPVLGRVISYALERHKARRSDPETPHAAAMSTPPPETEPNPAGLVGTSPVMQRLSAVIARVATSDVSVVVIGESGTGKELAARALHEGSRRRSGPFVAVNCSAIPEALLESELFGHERGAFTDAREARPGLFARASGGTLLLDEIADLPMALQPKLLRALQERVVRPVGGNHEVPFDARIVAATNQSLTQAMRESRFREDLFYRIAAVEVTVPPLRERGDDVIALASHFLRQVESRRPAVLSLSPTVVDRLRAYAWPGNVRELRNAIEAAAALASGDRITLADLPRQIRTSRPASAPPVLAPPGGTLAAMERWYILRALEIAGGDKSRAARELGIARKTLYRKLKTYGASPRT